MKSIMKLIGIIALAALTGFFMTGCKITMPENNGSGGTGDNFIPVTNITGVNTSVVVGTVSLGGKVVPSNATNQTINWSVQREEDDIKGTISGNLLTTTKEGDITVMATVENGIAVGKNYTQKFYLSVEPFVAVSKIVYDGPTEDEVGEIYLDATVYPDDASYTDIIWLVKNAGRTKATINGDVLTTKAEGTVVVRAVIINGVAEGKNYSQDFSILVRDDSDDIDDDDDDPD
jgi:endo-1,4-beta-xylanase